MGQTQSFPEAHVRIYRNLVQIQSPQQRVQMIQTLMSSPEHLQSAKAAGIYAQLLYYCQMIQAGQPGAVLPGERAVASQAQQQHTTLVTHSAPSQAVRANQTGNEKALNYFSACLRILELEEEVALTPDVLKTAYKKAVIRAHPDKGGSEKEFEAVTKAYAYLGEIMRRIHGGRAAEGKVEAPQALASNRGQEAEKWKMVEPVALNPNKLNLQTFNDMFEKTKIPDPEDNGYGDWLKGDDQQTSGPKFSGKFNREVFHKMFEEEAAAKAKRSAGQTNALMVQEMSLASRVGYATELGRGAREDFTVAPHEGGKLAFTDLKKAYTEYNSFSHETAGVSIQSRSFEQAQVDRKAAPAPLNDHELSAITAAERAAQRAEEQRKLRMAQQAHQEEDYFERMKRLVIRN